MAQVRARDSGPARALELLALTAARRDEVRCATFGEFDLEDRVWVIPAARTKRSGEPHVVPLSDRAAAIIAAQRAIAKDPNGCVFVSKRTGGAMGQNQIIDVMKEICGDDGPVPH